MKRQHKSIGSAHRGLSEWLFMRLSATYMGAFALAVAAYWLLAGAPDYHAWRSWFSGGAVRTGWALFFAALLLHAWFGIRSVFMDYLKPAVVRFTASTLAGLGLLALAVWTVAILIGAHA